MNGVGDERTIDRPPSKRAALQLGHTLALGTRLRDYEINGLIGEGGFGIVYLAWDHSLRRKVAIKEYMPASMVSRLSGSSAIVVKSERHVDTFRAGLKSFVNEARLLARFDHRSLVKVYRFWEENGTAYMVMPFYEGPTLKTALAELGRPPSEAEMRVWLRPLLDALAVLHAAQCFHRDIAPDNILLTPTGPLLLDFGAARRVIGDMTHALTVVLKPGYAPIEQYGDMATMAQGAWTDLYALACVVYYAITGKTPTSSVERLMDDRMEPLTVAAAGRYSPAFLHAIDLALAVRPQDRPQNERQFRDLLDADFAVEAASAPPATSAAAATQPPQALPVLATAMQQRTATDVPPRPAPVVPPRSRTSGWVGAAILLVVAILAAYVWTLPGAKTKATAASAPAATASASAMLPSVTAPAVSTATPEPLPVALPATPPAVLAPAVETPLLPASKTIPRETAHPVASAAAARPRRESPPRLEPPSKSDPPPTPRRSNGVRCSDILRKGSLESLSADEAAYLKRECR